MHSVLQFLYFVIATFYHFFGYLLENNKMFVIQNIKSEQNDKQSSFNRNFISL